MFRASFFQPAPARRRSGFVIDYGCQGCGTATNQFRVEVKHPDKRKEYLLKLDSETPEGESMDYPRLRAAQTIKLNFLVDIPIEEFREVTEAEASKMKLQPLPSSRHDTSLWEILN
jgi:hypothetical protein